MGVVGTAQTAMDVQADAAKADLLRKYPFLADDPSFLAVHQATSQQGHQVRSAQAMPGQASPHGVRATTPAPPVAQPFVGQQPQRQTSINYMMGSGQGQNLDAFALPPSTQAVLAANPALAATFNPTAPIKVPFESSASLKHDAETGEVVNEHGHSVIHIDRSQEQYYDVNNLPDIQRHGFEPKTRVSAEDPSDSFNFEHDHLKVKEQKKADKAAKIAAEAAAAQAAQASGQVQPVQGEPARTSEKRGQPKSMARQQTAEPARGAPIEGYTTEGYIINKDKPASMIERKVPQVGSMKAHDSLMVPNEDSQLRVTQPPPAADSRYTSLADSRDPDVMDYSNAEFGKMTAQANEVEEPVAARMGSYKAES